MKKRAIFIDKDGVLVDNSGYPEIIPTDKLLENDILEGLKYIKKKAYKIIIVSNQPWIAKNRISFEKIISLFDSVVNQLKQKHIFIDDYVFCPHQTSDNCNCKKPKPKMILDMSKKYDIDLINSYMIGDMDLDILTGKSAGTKTVLVLTGKGKEYQEKTNADYIIKNLNEIQRII